MLDADDPLHVLRAELDQALAQAPELARMTRGFFDAYRGENFSEAQSLYLTVTQIQQHPGTAPK